MIIRGLVTLFSLSIFFPPFSAQAADNFTCADTGLDWYTQAVGETPCKTYSRLRLVCNSQFEIGTLSTATPPDYCTDQVGDCCCNSISFALSMLCLNCQYGISNNGNTGYDAGTGAYGYYLGTCSPVTNNSLPTDIQTAVCSNDIKVMDGIYTDSWGDGSWYYIYSSQSLTTAYNVAAGNVFTKCPSTSSSSSNSVTSLSTSIAGATASSASVTSSSSVSAGLGTGATVGIAVGVTVGALLVIAGLVALFCLRRKKAQREKDVRNIDPNTYIVDPLPSHNMSQFGGGSGLASESEYGPGSSSGYGSSRNGLGPGFIPASKQLRTMNAVSPAGARAPYTSLNMHSDSSASFAMSSPQRHVDAGPVPQIYSSDDEGLPPAYGEQIGAPSRVEGSSSDNGTVQSQMEKFTVLNPPTDGEAS